MVKLAESMSRLGTETAFEVLARAAQLEAQGVEKKLAPALLTGNTVVIKPSPYTPLTNLKMAEVMSRTFPPSTSMTP